MDIEGNDSADLLAKIGADNPLSEPIVIEKDYSYWKSILKERTMNIRALRHQNNVWDCPPLRNLLGRTGNSNLIVGINELDKQMARLRTNYVSLNDFLFRHNLSDSKFCQYCRSNKGELSYPETASHYLLHCTKYSPQRQDLFTKLLKIAPNRKPYLCLLPHKSRTINVKIAKAICEFIKESKNVDFL